MLYFSPVSNRKLRKFLEKFRTDFEENRSTISKILNICRIIGGVRAKNLEATLVFEDFSRAFDFIDRGKLE